MKNTLKDKNVIDKIFKTGKTKSDGILLIKSIESSDPKILIAVSSKKFPRAVDRNLIKRLIRESIKSKEIKTSLAIVYIGNNIPDLPTIKKSVLKLL